MIGTDQILKFMDISKTVGKFDDYPPYIIKNSVLSHVMKIGPKPLLFIPGTPRLIRGNYFLD